MKKAVVKIFNLIFLGASALSLAMFATKDFVALDVTYPITKDFVVEKLDGKFGDNIKREDLEEAFKDGVELKINVSITANSLFESISNKTAVTQSLKDSITRTAEGAVDALHDPLNTVVEKVAKNMAKQQAEQSIKDQISHFNTGSSSSDELYDKYVTDEDLTNLTDNVYDALTGEDATVDKVVDAMASDINDILGKMSEEPGFEGATFDPNSEQGQEIKDSITEALDEFGLIDSEGKINDPDTAMAIIINKMLNGSDSNDSSKTEDENEDGTEKQPIPSRTFIKFEDLPFPAITQTEYTVEVGKEVSFDVDFGSVEEPALVNVVGDAATVTNATTDPSSINTFVINGVSEGSVTFTITRNGYEVSPEITVNVIPLEKAINFKSETIKVDINKTKKLEIERNEAVDPAATVTYELSEVNPEGSITLEGDTLTSHGEGTAKITATCDGVTATAMVKSEETPSLKKTLTTFVDDLITDAGIYDIVDSFGGYIVYGLFALMAPWVLFALLTIFRTLRKGKCWTKPWVIFTFCFGTFVLAAVQIALTMFSSELMGLLGNIPGISGILEQISSIQIGLSTSCFIPGIVYAAFIPLTIIYMIVCHGYKKQLKAEKKAKKAAAK